jgi:hypothetical protein
MSQELADESIAVTEAKFPKPRNHLPHFWAETVDAPSEKIELTWAAVGEVVLMPGQLGESYSYGVASTLAPAGEARLTVNGVQAAGATHATEREGRPFGTSCLTFSESWTEPQSNPKL